MKIHKKTSIPHEHHSTKNVSCDVLIWNGEYYAMAYHNYLTKEWYHSLTLEPIEEDFVWIYPPINKMKEVFNIIKEKRNERIRKTSGRYSLQKSKKATN